MEEHMSFLSLLTTELDNEYSTLINAILFTKSNTLHPSIMTPHQFLNGLSKISNHLPVSTNFALPSSTKNAYELLSIAKISVYHSQTKLIFKIANPLVAQLNYNVCNIIPLPTRFDNVFILTEYKYLALSESQSTYIPLHNFDNCHTLSTQDTICYLNTPTFATRTKPICEVEILLNPNHIPTTCDNRVIKMPLESWYKLISTNKWLYVFKNPMDITINCRHEKPTDIEIKNEGVLSIKPSCKIYTSTTIISSTNHNSLSSENNLFFPDFDIIDDDCIKSYKQKYFRIAFDTF